MKTTEGRWRAASRSVRVLGWIVVVFLATHSMLLIVAAVPDLARIVPAESVLTDYLVSTSWPALAVEALLVLAVWLAFGVPRFRRGVASTFSVVSALGILAFVLAYGSYATCSGAQAPFFTAVSRSLLLFLGTVDDPFGTVDGCAPSMPLALQAARLAAIVAIGIGVIAALALLFRAQLDRVLVRFSREVDLVVGSVQAHLRLLERIGRMAPQRRRIVVLSDREYAPARPPRVSLLHIPAEGAHIPSVLNGRARIRSVYLLDPDVNRVLEWIEAVRTRLASDESSRVIVARIDDVWQAEHWRRELISPDGAWLVDVISPYEQTARAIADHLIAAAVERVVVVGRSPLRLALASELAQRRRELRVMRWSEPAPPELVFVGEDAETAHRHHLMRQARFGNVDDIRSDPRPPTEANLAAVVGGAPNPAIVLTEVDPALPASALAAAHPTWNVYARDDAASALSSRPVLGGLVPFGIGVDLDPEGELHVWERAARIIHNNYLHDHGLGSGPAAVEWTDLPPFYRNSNLRLVTTALASAVAVGRTWGAFEGPSTGSRHGIPQDQLASIAAREHEHWLAHYRREGWRFAPVRDDDGKRHPRLLAWDALDDDSRRRTVQGVSDALDVLAALGYRSTPVASAAPGAPTDLRRFRRTGEVTARRSEFDWSWRAGDGTVLQGSAGDWRVTDHEGRSWSVKPDEFATTYAAIGSDRWRRTGAVTARPAVIGEEVATLEGPAVVTEESWVLHSPSGARWILPVDQFRATYEPFDDAEDDQ